MKGKESNFINSRGGEIFKKGVVRNNHLIILQHYLNVCVHCMLSHRETVNSLKEESIVCFTVFSLKISTIIVNSLGEEGRCAAL